MANRFLGEARVEVAGKIWTLRCDMNAMCAFEDATGKDALAAFAGIERGKGSVRDMRAAVWAFLQHHHPEATLADAGQMLSENLDVLRTALEAANPTAEEVGDLGNGAKAKRSA